MPSSKSDEIDIAKYLTNVEHDGDDGGHSKRTTSARSVLRPALILACQIPEDQAETAMNAGDAE